MARTIRPYLPPPSSLVDTKELQKTIFFLVAKPLPPPLLVAVPLKKTDFFAASLAWYENYMPDIRRDIWGIHLKIILRVFES